MVEPFRIDPKMPSAAYKTYQLRAPLDTHWKPATCEEVACQAQARGWTTRIDESTDLGARQAHYIRTQSGRKYTVTKELDYGSDFFGITVFTFEAGQRCFASHQQPLEREPMYLVRDGDHRGNPLGTKARLHTRADFWVDDFATHQAKLADQIEKG